MEDIIVIHVKNWDDHQGRKDIKKCSWFKVDHDLFDDPKVYAMSAPEFKVWMFILCQCSRQNTPSPTMNITMFQNILTVSKNDVHRALQKFQSLQLLQVRTLRGRYGSVRKRSPEEMRGEERREEEIREEENKICSSGLERTRFDFLEIYESYPRKQGKQRGVQALSRSIKSQQDYQLLCDALSRYKSYLAENSVDKKYVQMFSTWANNWRDWLDENAGSVVSTKSEDDLRRIYGNDFDALTEQEKKQLLEM